jgi:glycosyltransferase involved in cell wall biosynthesis
MHRKGNEKSSASRISAASRCRDKLRRKETLLFISRDISILSEVTDWFAMHTGFNIGGISPDANNLLGLADHLDTLDESRHHHQKSLNGNGLEERYVIELNSKDDLAGRPSPDLSSCPRVSISVGSEWPPDVKGFSVLAAIRSELGLLPQLSVIVPNYNHGPYLRKRLHSIYAQSFKDFEVILLDDASTDDSNTILDKYAHFFPHVTRRAYNQSNSGSAFAQWGKGIALASAALIWIAESDDFAELDLLEVLLPYFEDENIRLAYCYPMFVNGAGIPQPSATEHYFGQASSNKWSSPYVETGHNEVNQVLGAVNTIPNVSSVVLRKPDDSVFVDQAATYKLCGDWFFYLELIRGWKIAFTNETRSYFRFQDTGVTGTTLRSSKYVEEHLALAESLAQKYRISPDVLRRFFEQLARVLKATGVPENIRMPAAELEISTNVSERSYLNILLVTQGFFLGGGEILPVHLANELRRQGHNVLVLSLDVFPDNARIRSTLSSDIPVYRAEGRITSEETFIEFIRDNGIDLVNSHGHGSDLFVLKYIGKETIPWLVTMHGGYEFLLSNENSIGRPEEYRHVKKCLDRQLERVDKWIYIADKNLEPFGSTPEHHKDRFVKITNGLKKSVTNGVSRSELGIPDDAFVLCCATRAIPEKGWHHVIELTERVRARVHRDVHLLLLGEGPVLGSSYSGESSPLCIIECLFSGRPLLVTDIGECRNMLSLDDQSTVGAVFSLHRGKITNATLSQMERWLVDIIQDSARHRQLCRLAEKRSESFRIEAVAAQYIETYRDVIEAESFSSLG